MTIVMATVAPERRGRGDGADQAEPAEPAVPAMPGGIVGRPVAADASGGDDRAGRRRGRSKDEYLHIALELANDRSRLAVTPYAYAVAHVDIAQVAEAAGVSRTALYRLWETQESFRADLAAYLAASDDAPWMDLDTRHFDAPVAYPDQLQELARRRLNADQEQLAADPRPLLRAGLAGYPDAAEVTAVIAERERARLARHAGLVERALRSAGRCCPTGVEPADISLVINALADGLALATRMVPPHLPLVVERPGEPGRPWSLLALGACAVFDGLSRPVEPADVIDLRSPLPGLPPAAASHVDLRVGIDIDIDGDAGIDTSDADADVGLDLGPAPPAGRDRDGGRPAVSVAPAAAAPCTVPEAPAAPEDPGPTAGTVTGGTVTDGTLPGGPGTGGAADSPPTGRRLDYLRLAAALASTEPSHHQPTDAGGLGYVGLDTLARAAGVTRAAVRKLWPTQAAFRSELFAHLLATHRQAVVQRLRQSADQGPGDLLRRAGDALFEQARADLDRVSHLTFAPQLVLPGFRHDLHRRIGPLLDAPAAALRSLLAAVGRRPRPEVAGRPLAVLVLALVDGATRMLRTHPGPLPGDRCDPGGDRSGDPGDPGDRSGDRAHSLLGLALEPLLLGLSLPVHPTDTPEIPRPSDPSHSAERNQP